MTALDRTLQRWRISKAKPYIPSGASVLDIGCADGALFRQLGGQIGNGVGIDPSLAHPQQTQTIRLFPGRFPADVPDAGPYDVITLLAVVEHLPVEEQRRLARACESLLNPGGLLILTVPSRLVDPILKVLRFTRILDGMCLDEHHGFAVEKTPSLFCAVGLELVRHERFQLGLNNLFVFRKPAERT